MIKNAEDNLYSVLIINNVQRLYNYLFQNENTYLNIYYWQAKFINFVKIFF